MLALFNKTIQKNEIKISETVVMNDKQHDPFTAYGAISEITEDLFIVESDGETFNILRSNVNFSFMIGDEAS